jgi:hypothetical protein
MHKQEAQNVVVFYHACSAILNDCPTEKQWAVRNGQASSSASHCSVCPLYTLTVTL